MSFENSQDKDTINTALEPILMNAITRFRALLPEQVELALDLLHSDLRVRARGDQLEDAVVSACLVAWQSMGALATQIIVELKEVLLDDVVLDTEAEKLQGGLPPRRYAWLVITNSSRTLAGPFSSLVPAPKETDARPSSARRLKLQDIRTVVEQHQGWLTVLPEPGKGTAFEMFIPTALPLEIPVVNESGSELKHIIYVDDYDAMRDLVSETLPDAGFQVTCFESGLDAFEAIKAEPFKYDAVVSDYKLQGYCGIDLLKQTKLFKPDLPVIIISGYVDDALRSKAFIEGAALVVSKTSDLSALCVELRILLDAAPNPALVNYSEWAKL